MHQCDYGFFVKHEETRMNRRDAFLGAGASVLATLSATAVAQEMAHDHSHMHGERKYQTLLNATSDCVVNGQVCLAHCLVLLGEGDNSLAGCSKAVSQMLALCAALQNLASQESALVPDLAKVALQGCQRCANECRKHADQHAECRACMDSCNNCIKQCEAVLA